MNPLYENIERTALYLPFFFLAAGALISLFETALMKKGPVRLKILYMSLFYLSFLSCLFIFIYSITGSPSLGTMGFSIYFLALITAGLVLLGAAMPSFDRPDVFTFAFFAASCALAAVFTDSLLMRAMLFTAMSFAFFCFCGKHLSGKGGGKKKAFYLLTAVAAASFHSMGVFPQASFQVTLVFLLMGSGPGTAAFEPDGEGTKPHFVIQAFFELMLISYIIESYMPAGGAAAVAFVVVCMLAVSVFNNIAEESYLLFAADGFSSVFFLCVFAMAVTGCSTSVLRPVYAAAAVSAFALYVFSAVGGHSPTVSKIKYNAGRVIGGFTAFLDLMAVLMIEVYVFCMIFRHSAQAGTAAVLFVISACVVYAVNFINNTLIFVSISTRIFGQKGVWKAVRGSGFGRILLISAGIAALVLGPAVLRG